MSPVKLSLSIVASPQSLLPFHLTKEYDEALRIDPNRTDVYVTRAALRLELGDREGAAEDFGRARRINPDDQVPQSRPK